ncbi:MULTISPECIES: serine/threonine-protein kinase [unclassified Streptomyces]|uniref:serine/threonine-protein kinase n=1 Tax=unclassified Streptomyces TaxID=2593676 RepID=UPI001BE56A04|nr:MULTISPECIES: serine/threonine-protein kinase [unclassified Streptomyces]MBT2405300.1 serine/threonine protein kinase [Streptomyces sp. ISL-21]MBT2613292.1 serine/threonine protein kinase [Streptomyces sp. ISL-87]
MEPGGILADRYVLVEPIATGAQGTVWRAVDRRDGAEVAVKVSGGSDVESLWRLVCEQSVRIGHPHVLAPVDWFIREGEAWLVLPLVRGGTVAGLLDDYGALPPAIGLLMAEQMLDALAAVHAAGLVHRDVKPSNLLLTATGSGRPHLLLADFGVARVSPHLRLTSRAVAVGTPGYLAPEVLKGADSSPAQDLYAAGVVLRSLGGPSELVDAMVADQPERRPSAVSARDAIARLRTRLGDERWPVLWEGEPFIVPDQFADGLGPGRSLADADGPAADTASRSATPPEWAPQLTGPRRRAAVTAAVLACTAAIAAAVALAVAADGSGGAEPPGGRPSEKPSAGGSPARLVPTDAATGMADPEGPGAFSRCKAEDELAIEFSPEGYVLRCTHVPGTRNYEWAPLRRTSG